MSTSIFDPALDHILTVLLGLDLTGPDNLNVEMFHHHGITGFQAFKVLHPGDFKTWSYLIPGDSLSDRQPIPASIYEGLSDLIYFLQHLIATNHDDRDNPIKWTHANFGLGSDVIFIYDDNDTASTMTTATSVIDQALEQVFTLLLRIPITNDDDATINNDNDDAESAASAATMSAGANLKLSDNDDALIPNVDDGSPLAAATTTAKVTHEEFQKMSPSSIFSSQDILIEINKLVIKDFPSRHAFLEKFDSLVQNYDDITTPPMDARMEFNLLQVAIRRDERLVNATAPATATAAAPATATATAQTMVPTLASAPATAPAKAPSAAAAATAATATSTVTETETDTETETATVTPPATSIAPATAMSMPMAMATATATIDSYLRQTHCKYKPHPLVLPSFNVDNNHLRLKHCKYKSSQTTLLVEAISTVTPTIQDNFTLKMPPIQAQFQEAPLSTSVTNSFEVFQFDIHLTFELKFQLQHILSTIELTWLQLFTILLLSTDGEFIPIFRLLYKDVNATILVFQLMLLPIFRLTCIGQFDVNATILVFRLMLLPIFRLTCIGQSDAIATFRLISKDQNAKDQNENIVTLALPIFSSAYLNWFFRDTFDIGNDDMTRINRHTNSKPSAAPAGSFGQRAQSAGRPPHPSGGQPSCRSSGRLSRPHTSNSGTTLIGNATVSPANNTSRNSIIQSGVDSDSKSKFLPAFPATYWKNIDEHKDRISGDSGRRAGPRECSDGRGGCI